MNWVLEHLQFIIAAAGAIAWWLGQRRKARDEEADGPAPHPEATFGDPELAERTRRIREEIQRKIEQRAKGYATEQPRTVRQEEDADEEPPFVEEEAGPAPPPPVARRAASHDETERQAEILEQQAALAERLREAQVMKEAVLKRTEFEQATADRTAAILARTRSSVMEDLRSPEALRRAFILREVLGPPVALR